MIKKMEIEDIILCLLPIVIIVLFSPIMYSAFQSIQINKERQKLMNERHELELKILNEQYEAHKKSGSRKDCRYYLTNKKKSQNKENDLNTYYHYLPHNASH